MICFAITVEQKHEYEAKGYKCLGTHTVRENGVPAGVKWEFDVTEDVTGNPEVKAENVHAEPTELPKSEPKKEELINDPVKSPIKAEKKKDKPKKRGHK